ncbi:MAG: MFS transporter [Rubrivivax sp.]|nr:MFS transporter [Rubrivivax sp.]
MYHAEAGARPEVLRASLDARARSRVPRMVVFIGCVSLLTDVAAEMVASVLPLYLFMVLRLSPLEYGWIDGLFNGSSAIVRVWFAHWADRTQQHKRIAFLGYALSALSRIGLFVAGLGGWISVAVVLLLDRVGKGIRTAPRDAMIAQCTSAPALGAAFGVHRAMDAVGALAGPLLATGLLFAFPGRFDLVFAVSAAFAISGLVVLARWVKMPAAATAPEEAAGGAAPPGRTASAQAAGPPPATRAPAEWRALLRAPYVALCGCCALLALFTVSDGMVYAGLQARGRVDPAWLPMLFVATAGVFMAAAIPIGRLSDRFGPMSVFAAGHVGLVTMYALASVDLLPAPMTIAATVTLLGLYYAATDGVVMALLARGLPAAIRTTGMAVVTSVIGLARMAASVFFGWCWTEWSHESAMGVFAAGLTTSLLLTLLAIRWWSLAAPSTWRGER